MRRLGVFYIVLICVFVLVITVFGKMYTSINLNSRYADIKLISSLTKTGQCFEVEPGVYHKNGFELDTNKQSVTLSGGKQIVFSNTKIESVKLISEVVLVQSTTDFSVPLHAIQVTLSHKVNSKERAYEQMLIKVGE